MSDYQRILSIVSRFHSVLLNATREYRCLVCATVYKKCRWRGAVRFSITWEGTSDKLLIRLNDRTVGARATVRDNN